MQGQCEPILRKRRLNVKGLLWRPLGLVVKAHYNDSTRVVLHRGDYGVNIPRRHTGMSGIKKQGPWYKIPQLLNALRYYLTPKDDEVLEYDPFQLRVFSNRQYVKYGEKFYIESLKQDKNLGRRLSTNDMDIDAFKYVLAQVPAVRTVDFVGRGEPLLNPDIFEMIDTVAEYNQAYTSLTTTGMLLDKHGDDLLDSGLNQLVVRCYGHRPSAFHAMSGLEALNFPEIEKNLRHFVKKWKSRKSTLEVVLQMTVDVHSFRDIPDMLTFAQKMGVNALWVDNYLSPSGDEASERSLYDDYEPVKEFLAEVMGNFAADARATGSDFNLKLPVLLSRDMSESRNCSDPYTVLSVDGDCTVLPCSRQMIYQMPGNILADFKEELLDPDKAGKIWDEDFWNNPMYQWMRQVHTPPEAVLGENPYPVPNPCQHCPKNVGN